MVVKRRREWWEGKRSGWRGVKEWHMGGGREVGFIEEGSLRRVGWVSESEKVSREFSFEENA